jgi:benzoyl-CoA reductase/2-hydroxyglutaryl-CoA dehydratase subunit BcrC/BadD/HgdB
MTDPEVDFSTGKIDQLLRYMKFLSRFYRNQPDYYYFQLLQDYFTSLRNAHRNGGFVAAHTIFFPVEILQAMDLVPMHLEFTSSLMSLFGVDCSDLLAEAARMGLPVEICSAHRIIAGALAKGAMPRADAVVCSNLVCDNAIKSGELTMEFDHCPGFVFDYPFNHTETADILIIRELRDTIAFLENASGHTMDWNKLSANIAETNKQIGLIRRINDVCKTVPSPFKPQDFIKFLIVDYLGAGRMETTRYLQELYNDLAAKAAAGHGFAVPERLRLMATMLSPWYLQGEVDKILSEHGAAIVCNPNLCDWREPLQLDPEIPLESIAMKLAACSPLRMFGPLDERGLGPLVSAVREYRIDGVINFNHLGCRQMGPMFKIYKETLARLDVPILNIDCDLVDRTVTSPDEVRQKLEQFFELLEDR